MSSTDDLPDTMKTWTFSLPLRSSFPSSLTLNQNGPLPALAGKDSLIHVEACSLNPVDFKIPEGVPWPFCYLVVKSPATPGSDFAGTLVKTGDEGLKGLVGKKVMGHGTPVARYGGCAEYMVASGGSDIVPIPDTITATKACASAGIAAKTAFQAIKTSFPSLDAVAGSQIFVNGGSGGVGHFVIQIAKALGAARVGASCSTANVDFCKGLGADVVIDYRDSNIAQVLTAEVDGNLEKNGYDVLIDAAAKPRSLYASSSSFLKPSGQFVQLAGSPTMEGAITLFSQAFIPRFLGGGSRKWRFMLESFNNKDAEELARLVGDGKVKAVIANGGVPFKFEEVPKAYEVLKKGSGAMGKVVVDVAGEA